MGGSCAGGGVRCEDAESRKGGEVDRSDRGCRFEGRETGKAVREIGCVVSGAATTRVYTSLFVGSVRGV